MQKTEKLGLNLFEGSDPVLAENFNENTNLLETAIQKKCSVSYGTWAGDGNDNKQLTFDSKAVLVFICSSSSVFMCFQGHTSALYLTFNHSSQNGRPISWSEDGCILTLQESGHFNQVIEKDYRYIAFLEN